MKALALLALCAQLWGCSSVSPPWRPALPGTVHPLPCNDSQAAMAAKLALGQINAHRREGYIFSLYRIADVQEHFQESSGTVYYLTLDVLETVCHVLSKRSWESCEVKPLHLAVYGQCKATLHINRPRRIVHLYNYDCTLRPVPRSRIKMMCPDCPIPSGLDNPKYLEAAQLSLDKFNRESNLTKYFSLDSITHASKQWVIGASYFVEYIVKETNCTKDVPVADLSKCTPLSCEFGHTGFCKGSVMNAEMQTPVVQHVSGSCEIFESEAAENEEQKHKASEEEYHQHESKGVHGKKGDQRGHDHHHKHDHDHSHEHDNGHDHDHKHDHNHTHHDDHKHDHDHTHHHGDDHDHKHDHNHTHHHNHKHDHNHTDHHDHKHQHLHEHEHHHHSPPGARRATVTTKTVGVVKTLPSIDDPSAFASATSKKVAPDAEKPVVLPIFPDQPVVPNGARPMPLPWLPHKPDGPKRQPPPGPSVPRNPFGEPTILPFPEISSKSNLCPGEAKNYESLIDSLLASGHQERAAPPPTQGTK